MSTFQDAKGKPIWANQNTFDTEWKDSKISGKKTKAWPGPVVEKTTSSRVTEVHYSKDLVDINAPKQPFTWLMLLNPIWWLLTFASVSLLWIPFRADSMETTLGIYERIFSSFDFAIVAYAFDINPLLFVLLAAGLLATLQPAIVKRTFRKAYDLTPAKTARRA